MTEAIEAPKPLVPQTPAPEVFRGAVATTPIDDGSLQGASGTDETGLDELKSFFRDQADKHADAAEAKAAPADAAPTKTEEEPTYAEKPAQVQVSPPKQELKGSPEAEDAVAAAVRKALEERNAQEQARQQELNRFRVEGEKILAQARAEAERLAGEQRQLLDRLRSNPVEAIKQAGWDAQGLLTNLAEEGTPLGQAQRQILQERASRAALEDQVKKLSETVSGYIEGQKRAQEEAQYRQAVDGFLAVALDDKHPTLSRVFATARGKDYLAREADAYAVEYAQQTGRYASWAQIADHLESLYRGEAAPPAQTETETAAGKPANGKPPAAKPPTQSAASERTTPPRGWSDAPEREQNQAILSELRGIFKEARQKQREQK